MLTSVGRSAFYGCLRINKLRIGISLESIGAEAFKGCTGLLSSSYGVVFAHYDNWKIHAEEPITIEAQQFKSSANAASYLVSIYSQYYWERV